ncbi:MAG: hypothetical protein A2V64_05660 [Bacteroidetes bacterium RBG_13_43_22]|nr:MAG: hypothetical protein A2V64_05660 [Bacteroidetes bacterium RBG_13_43_22]
MKKSFVLLSLALTLVSCNKETDDFIWQKSFGIGDAFCVQSASDSGIVSCGTVSNSPYLLRLKKDKTTEIEYSSEKQGLFSSVWFDTSRYVAGGSSDGKMLLACIDNDGSKIWDTLLTAAFKIRRTGLLYSGSGKLVAVGTAMADSVESGSSGILFVEFDTTGNIILKKETADNNFIAASNVTSDFSGNIFLPLTRKKTYSKAQASVAKFSGEFNKLWETDLYNNSNFGASSLGIILDDPGNVYVSGDTELSSADSVLNNSFLTSLTSSGSVRWKKYLEKTNSGSAVVIDDNDVLMILNTNCFIVNMANPDDGADEGKISMFGVCNSKETDAFGRDLDMNYDGNLLVAGSKGGNYYLALKSIIQ